ncbi:MAG TPA: tetratricopeptide repeat protein [Pyrinomonadaceae bacterium]|nr:tetratricopeptide repeat protein [Pyrinomonadaceae bacterium]
MRKILLPSALVALSLAAACNGSQPSNTSARNSNSAGASQSNVGGANSNAGGVGVVSSHGGGPAGGASAPAAGDSSETSLIDTSALDANIRKAAEKAKVSGASAADKKAAADAYLARGNEYYSAGQPRLYKYALADFREVLKYDPENADAKQKSDMIVSIYQQMGRPVPDVTPKQ